MAQFHIGRPFIQPNTHLQVLLWLLVPHHWPDLAQHQRIHQPLHSMVTLRRIIQILVRNILYRDYRSIPKLIAPAHPPTPTKITATRRVTLDFGVVTLDLVPKAGWVRSGIWSLWCFRLHADKLPKGMKSLNPVSRGQFIKRKKKNSRTLWPKILLMKHFLFLISAPPSYAECVSGGASIDDEGDEKTLGDTSFTPMYPFVNNYQFPSAPPPSYP